MALQNPLGDLSLEATQQSVLAALNASVTELPHQPADVTSDLTRTKVGRSTVGTDSIAAAVAAQTTRLHRLILSFAAAGRVEIRDGSGGTVLFDFDAPGPGVWDSGYCERPLAKTSVNTAMHAATTTAVQIYTQAFTRTSA